VKINLRKAAVVQQIITEEIRRIGSEDTKISVNLFESNITARLDEQANLVIATAQRVARLMEASRYFRSVLARKNAEHHITDYLAEDAMLAVMEQRVEALSKAEVRPDLDILTKEISARLNQREDKSQSLIGYHNGRNDYTISVNVLPKNVVDSAKAELENVRRRRRKIKDEMVSINVKNEIEVPDQIAFVLTELGLD